MDDFQLETYRNDTCASLYEKLKDKRCSYDMSLREKAYFSCHDSIKLIQEAHSVELINLGVKIFNRFIHHV